VRRANSSLTEQPIPMRLFAPVIRHEGELSRGWVKTDEDIDCRYRAVAMTRSGNRDTDTGQF